MNHINSWKIQPTYNENELLMYLDFSISGTFLLNTNNSQFNLLEKCVYDLAMYHFLDLGIQWNDFKNNYFIEFWWKTNSNNTKLHVDCDEYEKKQNNMVHPLRSLVTYFNDNDIPTIITNINFEQYKYKQIPDKKKIIISFPKKNKHITFNGSMFHGVCNLLNTDDTKRYMLAINIWNKKPSYVPYYDNIYYVNSLLNVKDISQYIQYKTDPLFMLSKTSNTKQLDLSNNMLDTDFYEVALYDKSISIMNHSFPLLKNYIEKNADIIDIMFSTKPPDTLIEKYGDLIYDLFELMNEEITLTNRLFKWNISNKIYSKDICEWIINESEKYATINGGWTTTRHENYPTTDLSISNIPNLFKFVLSSVQFLFPTITAFYHIPNTIRLNIVDFFIVKYDATRQNKLEYHKDGSHISFNILLNDETDFEGGGTKFENTQDVVKLSQGDMLFHCSKLKHCGLPISFGKRYLLVCFINLEW